MSFPGAVDEKKGKKREKVLCWRERKGWMNFAVEFHAPVVGCDEAGRSLFIPFPTPFPTMLCMWKNHFHFLTQHNCDCGTIRTESRGLDSPTHPTVCLHFCYREFYGDVSSFVLAKVWFFFFWFIANASGMMRKFRLMKFILDLKCFRKIFFFTFPWIQIKKILHIRRWPFLNSNRIGTELLLSSVMTYRTWNYNSPRALGISHNISAKKADKRRWSKKSVGVVVVCT